MTVRTTKAENTRGGILRAALGLFAKRGYRATTMREIAAAAETSLGLTYRYFPSKEAIVLAAYADLARRIENVLPTLPNGTMGERFRIVLDRKLALLRPHKEAFGALVGLTLEPSSGASVLSSETAEIRRRMLAVFGHVVEGADDAPPAASRSHVATLLYATHLVLLLAWLHDRSAHAARTQELFAMVDNVLRLSGTYLANPMFADGVQRVAATVDGFMGTTEPPRRQRRPKKPR